MADFVMDYALTHGNRDYGNNQIYQNYWTIPLNIAAYVIKKKKKKRFHTELQEGSLSHDEVSLKQRSPSETPYLAFCLQHPAKTDALSNLPSI